MPASHAWTISRQTFQRFSSNHRYDDYVQTRALACFFTWSRRYFVFARRYFVCVARRYLYGYLHVDTSYVLCLLLRPAWLWKKISNNFEIIVFFFHALQFILKVNINFESPINCSDSMNSTHIKHVLVLIAIWWGYRHNQFQGGDWLVVMGGKWRKKKNCFLCTITIVILAPINLLYLYCIHIKLLNQEGVKTKQSLGSSRR